MQTPNPKVKTSILILCTGNSCRSHLAEGILRAVAGDISFSGCNFFQRRDVEDVANAAARADVGSKFVIGHYAASVEADL